MFGVACRWGLRENTTPPFLLAVVGGLAAAGALAAPASAATAWNCGASSVYASVLGQPATAPFVANGGAAECKSARASHQPLDASSPLSAGVFVAQTELVGHQPATQGPRPAAVWPSGGVRSLPTLPGELPALKEVRARILALPETIELDLREPLSALAPDLQLPTMDLLAVRSVWRWPRTVRQRPAEADRRGVDGRPFRPGPGDRSQRGAGTLDGAAGPREPRPLEPRPGGPHAAWRAAPGRSAHRCTADAGHRWRAGRPARHRPAGHRRGRAGHPAPPDGEPDRRVAERRAGAGLIAGQPVVDTLLGLASVSHRGVDCAPPQATPPPPEDTDSGEGQDTDSGEVEGTEDGELGAPSAASCSTRWSRARRRCA